LTIDGVTVLESGTNSVGPTSTSQSSNFSAQFPASNALDGNPNTFTHTAATDRSASWTMEFQEERIIDQIILGNRLNCCGDRLRDIRVEIFDGVGNQTFASPLLNPGNSLGSPLSIPVTIPAVKGQRIVVSRVANLNDQVNGNGNILSLGEVNVSSRAFQTVELTAGPHDISFAFLDSSGPAGAQLDWIPPNGTLAPIPSRQLVPGSMQPGIVGEYFQLNFIPSTLDNINFAALNSTLTQVDATIDIPASETADNFAVQWNGYVYVDVPGEYEFVAGSEDGSRVYVNDVLVIDNPGGQEFTELSSSRIQLSKGLHRIRMEYFEDATGAGARLSWILPGQTVAEVIPSSHLFHQESQTASPEVGQIVLDGDITVATLANVFGDLAGSVGSVITEMQVSSGLEPILNYYNAQYGLNVTGPGRSWGISRGADLAFLNAPLRDSGIYIWSRTNVGAQVMLGGAMVSTPGLSVTTIIDPSDPFIYTAAGDFRLGISHQGLIPFVPANRDANFVEADLDISGHLYARLDNVQIPNTPATLRGEAVIDLAPSDLLARIPEFNRNDLATLFTGGFFATSVPDFALGLNGEVRMGLSAGYTGGAFTATVPIGGATVQYFQRQGGLTGAGQAGLVVSGGTTNPLAGTPFEDLFFSPVGFQYEFSARGTTPRDFENNFEINVISESGFGGDGGGVSIPGVGTINIGLPGQRVELQITPDGAELDADVQFLLGSATLNGNLDLGDGSFYLSAALNGPSLTILDSDVFDSVTSEAIVELGLNGLRPDGSRFTGFGAELDLNLNEISLNADIDLLGPVSFAIGGNLKGRFDAGVVNGRLAYSGSLSGEGRVLVDLPGALADLDITEAIDLAFADAIDQFKIPLPTIDLGAVEVALPEILVRLARNGPAIEIGELRINGLDVEQIAETLRDVYDLTAREVAILLDQAEYTAVQVAAGLNKAFNLTQTELISVLQSAAFPTEKVVEVLEDFYLAGREEIVQVLNQLGYATEEIGRVIRDAFGLGAREAAQLINSISDDILDTARTLQSVFGETIPNTIQILFEELNQGVVQLSRVLRDVFDFNVVDAINLLLPLSPNLTEVVRFIRNEYFQNLQQTVNLLRSANLGVIPVVNALRDVFNPGLVDIGRALAGAQYALSDIVRALRSVSNSVAETARIVLTELGRSPLDFVRAANAAGWNPTEWARELFNRGTSVVNIVRWLAQEAGQQPFQVASVLGQLGANISQVVVGLTSQYGDNFQTLVTLLLQARFTPEQIARHFGQTLDGLENLARDFGQRFAGSIDRVTDIFLAAQIDVTRIVDAYINAEFATATTIALLDSVGLNPREIGSRLEAAGHTLQNIVTGMFGRFSAEQVVDMLRFGLGRTNTFEIIPLLFNANFVRNEVLTALHIIGFTAESVAQVLTQVFNFGEEALVTALAGARFAVNEIEEAVEVALDRISDAGRDLARRICFFC
jgi:hypothetical protein